MVRARRHSLIIAGLCRQFMGMAGQIGNKQHHATTHIKGAASLDA
jgi:hypothetical protein